MYHIQYCPSGGIQKDSTGNPVVYYSDFEAMVALVKWAKEANLPVSDFLIVEA